MDSFDYTSIIWLTRGMYAIVDNDDYEKLSIHKWCARRHVHTSYATRGVQLNKKGKHTMMHRLIIECSGFDIDHINLNGLDNRKSNLRTCTPSQNKANQGLSRRNTSGFKGVTWNKQFKYWKASIGYNGVRKYASFHDPKQAAEWYDEMALTHHGEFARTNKMMGLYE